MKDNKFLWFLVVLAVILLGLFGWMMLKLKNPELFAPKAKIPEVVTEVIKTAKPFFPDNEEASLGGRMDWKRSSLQPIFNGSYKDNTGNYLKIYYSENGSSEVKEGKIFLAAMIPYINKAGIRNIVKGETLMNEFEVGEQFKILYISQIPSDFDITSSYCRNPLGEPIECMLSYQQLENNTKGGDIFYPMAFFKNK